jgi:hypothetical protein
MVWRMRRFALLAAALAGCALGGCTTEVGPSPAELKASWEAQNVSPQSYKQDLLAYMRTYLNDPTRIRDSAVSAPVLKDFGQGQRFMACVRFNARNSDGKYMGTKEGAAVYVSGKLDRFFDTPREAREICKDAAYSPFPELAALTR